MLPWSFCCDENSCFSSSPCRRSTKPSYPRALSRRKMSFYRRARRWSTRRSDRQSCVPSPVISLLRPVLHVVIPLSQRGVIPFLDVKIDVQTITVNFLLLQWTIPPRIVCLLFTVTHIIHCNYAAHTSTMCVNNIDNPIRYNSNKYTVTCR